MRFGEYEGKGKVTVSGGLPKKKNKKLKKQKKYGQKIRRKSGPVYKALRKG